MKGVLEMPMLVGTKGGVIQSHPTLAYTHGTLTRKRKKAFLSHIVTMSGFVSLNM
jgi:hydroxymethylglutaryl-CoA reductase